METMHSSMSELVINHSQPVSTVAVYLPIVEREEGLVRLSIHTDTLLSLLKAFYQLELPPDLSMEGRVGTPEQLAALEVHPIMSMYTSHRPLRLAMSRILTDHINRDADEMVAFHQISFTPASLGEQSGHTVGYYDVRSLVNRWQSAGTPHSFLPYFMGINTFKIGSETATEQELATLANAVQVMVEQADQVVQATLAANIAANPDLTEMNDDMGIFLEKLRHILAMSDPDQKAAALQAYLEAESQNTH